jgi:hypothetical protein
MQRADYRARIVGLLLLALALSSSLVAPVGGAERELARVALSELEVKGRAPKTGYSRAAFGPSWFDQDKNGCDTRNDILKRDLRSIVFRTGSSCVVLSGILIDPYSNERIEFTRGAVSSLDVQIDHVVSLSNAWQTGAFRWSLETRVAFANDPLNLLAVKGALNTQKSDGDAATWLPPKKSYRCDFVSRQIAVKRNYSLWVTAPEKSAMERILRSCPSKKLP